MRSLLRFVALLVLICGARAIHAQGNAPAQSPSPVKAESPGPQFRPALLGSVPQSLINKIDGQALLQKGQKDGAIMFSSLVAKDGRVVESRIYRGMPGTDALGEELIARLSDLKVVPAIYNRQPVEVLLFGTVVFAVENDKPRVRIFLHQDPIELSNASDFIAPQPVFGFDSKFSGLRYPQGEHPVAVTGIVDVVLTVDLQGNMKEFRVLAEDPPLLGFADAAKADFNGAKFIPAFRDGDPIEAATAFPVCYQVAEE